MASIGESRPDAPPSLTEQQQFWNSWNSTWRFRDGLDAFMQAQAEVAGKIAAGLPKGARVLDVGCGTGWLANSVLPFVGEAWGTDLSPGAIEDGQKRHPGVNGNQGILTSWHCLARGAPQHLDRFTLQAVR
jgi:cyclopropane fatty-acyl-phospholipid synthase-like methyltransferase